MRNVLVHNYFDVALKDLSIRELAVRLAIHNDLIAKLHRVFLRVARKVGKGHHHAPQRIAKIFANSIQSLSQNIRYDNPKLVVRIKNE